MDHSHNINYNNNNDNSTSGNTDGGDADGGNGDNVFFTAPFRDLSSQFITWVESITAEDINTPLLHSVVDGAQELLHSFMEFPLSLERRVLHLYFLLVVHHYSGNIGGSVMEIMQRHLDQPLIDSKWIDTHLQKVVSAALTLQRRMKEEKSGESASGGEEVRTTTNEGEALLDVNFVFTLTVFVQKVVPLTAHRTRKSWLMHSWIDLLLFRPQHSMIQDEQLRQAIMQIRNDLLQERNDGSKMLHASKLCGMAVDAMLRGSYNDPQVATDVLNLINKIIASEPANKGQIVRIHNHLLDAVIQKCNPISPEDKWKLYQVSLKRDGGEPNHRTLHEILVQCHEKKDWITASKVMEYIKHPSLSQNPTITRVILSVVKQSVSPARALSFWGSLPEDFPTKWHGFVLLEVLSIAMGAKHHKYWTNLARDILQRAAEMHDGSWPTPFFDTSTMQNRFEKLSHFMQKSLTDFGEKHNSDEHLDLAKRWDVFAEDQAARFGSFVHKSRRSRLRNHL